MDQIPFQARRTMTELPGYDAEIFGDLQRDDDLAAIVRSHLHMEARLIEIVEASLRRPERLDQLRLTFPKLLELAICVGLDDGLRKPLLALNALRNAVAHNLQQKLTQERVSGIYNAFAQLEKDATQASYHAVLRETGKGGPSFDACALRDRFAMMVLTLQGALIMHKHAMFPDKK